MSNPHHSIQFYFSFLTGLLHLFDIGMIWWWSYRSLLHASSSCVIIPFNSVTQFIVLIEELFRNWLDQIIGQIDYSQWISQSLQQGFWQFWYFVVTQINFFKYQISNQKTSSYMSQQYLSLLMFHYTKIGSSETLLFKKLIVSSFKWVWENSVTIQGEEWKVWSFQVLSRFCLWFFCRH